MTQDEEFFAWLDGELNERDAGLVASRVAASPELSAKAQAHRRMTAGLREAFQPVLGDTVAPRFQESNVVDFGRTVAQPPRRRSLAFPQLAAMAASLAIGLLIGSQLFDRDNSPVTVDGWSLVAAAALDRALDQRLASAPDGEGARIALTFRDKAGRICRSFTDVAASGLACRDGEQWRVRGLFPSAEGQAGDYRMAAGEHPGLAAMIDQTIAGEPFDTAQERTALEAGWR